MIKNVDTTIGHNKKLIPKYKGPYVADKVIGNDRYVIKDMDNFQVTQKPFSGVFDVSRMRPFNKVN